MNYKSRRWRHIREHVLRAAQYRCQESLRYGRSVNATTVHHIWPADKYPEYRFCEWNLLALSAEQHDAMHDRKTRELTALGEYWRRKTIPPT